MKRDIRLFVEDIPNLKKQTQKIKKDLEKEEKHEINTK